MYLALCTRIGLIAALIASTSHAVLAQKPYVGTNVNMVTGTKLGDGDPFATKQNEPSMAVSSLNANHLMAGSNDYRLVPTSLLADIPGDLGAADAWVGLYYSIDKGMTWRSTVLGGCPLNIPACNNPLSSVIKGRQFAADPTLRSAPYGIYLLSFIAGNRDSASNGVVAVQRYFDRPDTLSPDEVPFRQTDAPSIIDSGTTGQFKDKSWIAADIPGRPFNAGTCVLPGYANPVPAFNAYVVYTNFVGQSDTNPHPQILVARSVDCGKTFQKAVKVSQSISTNSGGSIAVDPRTGDVYVVWRQFSNGTSDPDAIWFAKSTDGGNRFDPAVRLTNFIPFDQATNGVQFRTNAFPAIAVSANATQSFIHVAFAARKTVDGDSRIAMISSANGGSSWGSPGYVDDWSTDPLVPFNPGRGHQFQPTLAFAGGKLMVGWFDQRYDQTSGQLRCPTGQTCRGVQDFREVRIGQGVFSGLGPDSARLASNDSRLGIVFTKYLSDATAGLTRKHSIDFFAAMAAPSATPAFASTRVSQYRYGNRAAATKGAQDVVQLQYNVPNRPIFVNNSASFLGDYADVTAQLMIPTGNSSQPYKFNIDPSNKVVFHATFTDNRNVIPPRVGGWNNRTPISVLQTNPDGSVAGVRLNSDCVPGQEGTQNQDIFTAQIGEDVGTFTPVNAKVLNGTTPRGFVAGVQNLSDQDRTYCLSIANQPVGGYAAFLQELTSTIQITATVPPRSSITRTVWVKSTNPNASVSVNVYGGSCSALPSTPTPLTVILLNPDPNSPKALSTDGSVDTANTDLSDVRVRDVAIKNTELTNTELTNTELTNTELTNTELTNTELTNTELTNTELTNTELTNTELTNTELTNTELTNTELTNTELTNTELTNTELTNSAVVDAQFNIANKGNTDVSLNLKTLLRDNKVPAGYKLQLAVRRIAISPYTRNCKFYPSQVNAQVVNIPDPRITSLTDPQLGQFLALDSSSENATIPLLPNERAHVVVRIVGPSAAEARQFGENALKLLGVGPDQTRTPIPLIIKTLALPEQTAATPINLPLEAFGGFGARIWSFANDVAPPAGLNLNPATGVLTGTLPAGTYTIKVKVTDGSTPTQNDVQTLILPVKFQSQTLTVAGLPPAGTSLTYGTAPTSFTVTSTASSGLPVTVETPGSTNACSAASTTVNVTSAGTCTVTVSQAGDQNYSPTTQTASYVVAPATQSITFGALSAKSYGEAPFAVSATASSNLPVGIVSTSPLVCTVSGSTVTIVGAGACSLTASQPGNANYLAAPSVTRTFTVSQATLTVVADSFTRLYGGANPVLTGTVSGAIPGDIFAATYSTSAAPNSVPGSYAVVPALVPNPKSANYTVVLTNGALIINAAPLGIAATSATKEYGAPLPAFSVVISGLVLGEGSGVLGGTLFYNTTATATSDVGSYQVTPGGLTSSNYVITFVPGNLSITKATPAFSGLAAPSIGTGTATTVLSGTISKGSSIPLGAVDITLSGVTAAAAITPATGAFAASFSTSALAQGTYTVTYAYPGNRNFNGVTATTNLRVAGWQSAGNMNQARSAHTAVKLLDGTVLLVAGNDASGATSATAEIYNPTTGTKMVVGNTPNKAAGHTATLLADGRVLIAGGGNSATEIYDPATKTFSGSGGMASNRSFHTATRLADGRVLVTGGADNSGKTDVTAVIYNPATGSFSSTGNMRSARERHTATLLPDGRVLLAGGRLKSGSGYAYLATTEIYNPATGTFSAGPNLTQSRASHTATAMGDGKVLIVGGWNGSIARSTSEVYTPVAGAAGSLAAGGSLGTARSNHTATLLEDGRVLVAGGESGATRLASAEFYGGTTFIAGPAMGAARSIHTSTLLNNGSVLVTGGVGSTGVSIMGMELLLSQ